MRSSRLFALVMALPRDGLTPAGELATRLEVSVRTIYRDVRALEAAGAPIRTETGPDGGIGLVAGWRSPFEALSTDEARALLLGGPGADLGLGAVLATARSKVRSGMPPAVRAQLDAVAQRFLLDTSGWFRTEEPAEHLEAVAAALWSGRRIDVRYEQPVTKAWRRLDPLGLVLKAGRWYLVAAHRDQPRTYRVGRITAVRSLVDAAARPDGFDLEAYWRTAGTNFAADLHRLPTRVRLARRHLPSLRAAVPGPVTAAAIEAALAGHAPDATGETRVTVDLLVESEEVALAQFGGVPELEVLAPQPLRAAFATRARRHAELND